MSTCAGPTSCEIYRDKKYCRKVEEKQDARGICSCRHSALACEVGKCIFDDSCGIKNGIFAADLIKERTAKTR